MDMQLWTTECILLVCRRGLSAVESKAVARHLVQVQWLLSARQRFNLFVKMIFWIALKNLRSDATIHSMPGGLQGWENQVWPRREPHELEDVVSIAPPLHSKLLYSLEHLNCPISFFWQSVDFQFVFRMDLCWLNMNAKDPRLVSLQPVLSSLT